jgi:3-hydroxymyristoyl/3-hydroxydecanoyl-(acyl carrier protein) dehydratase
MFDSEFAFGDLAWEEPSPSSSPPVAAQVSVGVPATLRYFDGHFPGDPIVPGVAQLGPLAETQARRAWPDLGAVTSVKRLKFMQALRPEDTLKLSLKRAGGKVSFAIFKGELECTRGTLVFG